MSTTYSAPVTIASYVTDGPLLSSAGLTTEIPAAIVDVIQNGWSSATASYLSGLINPDLLDAEQGLAEGTLVELTITASWPSVLGFEPIIPSSMANAINTYWSEGRITNPDGSAIIAWPGATGIAVGDDATGTLTLRAVTAALPIVGIIIGAVVAVVGYFAAGVSGAFIAVAAYLVVRLWYSFQNSQWGANVRHTLTQVTAAVGGTGNLLLLLLIGGGVLVAAGVFLPSIGNTVEGVGKIEEASAQKKALQVNRR